MVSREYWGIFPGYPAPPQAPPWAQGVGPALGPGGRPRPKPLRPMGLGTYWEYSPKYRYTSWVHGPITRGMERTHDPINPAHALWAIVAAACIWATLVNLGPRPTTNTTNTNTNTLVSL